METNVNASTKVVAPTGEFDNLTATGSQININKPVVSTEAITGTALSGTTASLSTVLEWSTLEQTAKGVIHREFVNMRRINLSVSMIQRWWRAKLKELKISGGT